MRDGGEVRIKTVEKRAAAAAGDGDRCRSEKRCRRRYGDAAGGLTFRSGTSSEDSKCRLLVCACVRGCLVGLLSDSLPLWRLSGSQSGV